MTNTITFAGNLADDAELRFTPSGKAVANAVVLVNRRVRNTETDEWEDAEPTRWPITVWGKPAENTAESLTKGTRTLVHGRVETESWADKETGEKRTRDIVVVDEIGVSLKFATASAHKNPKD